ncbi:hypothetical protein PV326_009891, partial [Microctonus aethiopoides]
SKSRKQRNRKWYTPLVIAFGGVHQMLLGQINGCIYWTLAGLYLMLIMDIIVAENNDEPILDSLTSDDILKSKRPFCNAFTGCGKKRSFNDNSMMEHQDDSEFVTIRLPLFLYRALIRVATREIRDAIERTSTIGNSLSTGAVISDNYSPYLPTRNFPIRKRYES